MSGSDKTTTTYLQKLLASTATNANTQPLVLETIWHHQSSSDNDSIAFELMLLDVGTDTSYSGHVTCATLVATAADLEIPADVFLADTRHMLTGELLTMATTASATATAEFLYEFTGGGLGDKANGGVGASTFTWRKRKTPQLIITYGSLAMSRATAASATDSTTKTSTTAALLLRSIDLLAERSVTMRRMQTESDRLRRAHHLLRDDFDECVQRKLELEQDLLAKFMALLNTKKQHIQELELELSLQPKQSTLDVAAVVGAGDEKLKIVVADRSSSNDDNDGGGRTYEPCGGGGGDALSHSVGALLNSQSSEDSLPLVLPRRARALPATELKNVIEPRAVFAAAGSKTKAAEELQPRINEEQLAYEHDTQEMIDDME